MIIFGNSGIEWDIIMTLLGSLLHQFSILFNIQPSNILQTLESGWPSPEDRSVFLITYVCNGTAPYPRPLEAGRSTTGSLGEENRWRSAYWMRKRGVRGARAILHVKGGPWFVLLPIHMNIPSKSFPRAFGDRSEGRAYHNDATGSSIPTCGQYITFLGDSGRR